MPEKKQTKKPTAPKRATQKSGDPFRELLKAIEPTAADKAESARQSKKGREPYPLTRREFKMIVHALMETAQAIDCLHAKIKGEEGMGIEVAGAVDAIERDVAELSRMSFEKLSGTMHKWFITYDD